MSALRYSECPICGARVASKGLIRRVYCSEKCRQIREQQRSRESRHKRP